ncbi:MAG: hypothetical protein IJ681_00220 [Bacteroidales bacterium]|nr:hypothetical protein [Bacteroidales bacterium]
MKTGNSEKIIRTAYLLELGVDFQESDLEVLASNGVNTLKGLSREFRDNIHGLNIGKLVWSGHYDDETQTVKIHTEQELFL